MTNLLQKLISDQTFYVTITVADIGSVKSLHTLFDKHLDDMLLKFEQNRMAWDIQNFELLGKKMVNHIWESVDAILEEVLWHKQLFDANVLIERLSSFIDSKIMVIRHA